MFKKLSRCFLSHCLPDRFRPGIAFLHAYPSTRTDSVTRTFLDHGNVIVHSAECGEALGNQVVVAARFERRRLRAIILPKLKPERCVPAKRLDEVWPYDLTCERVVNDRLTIKIKLNSPANGIFRTFR
jgi:hypothetical protein